MLIHLLANLLANLLYCLSLLADSPSATLLAPKGYHPVVCTNGQQDVEVVYGLNDLIYYTHSTDKGKTYAPAEVIDTLQDLFLVAQRRPQIASNSQTTLVLALNKAGNIFAYVKDKKTGRWTKRIKVSDQPDVAKEGFVSIAAGPGNMFYAVWNDLRGNAQNKVVGARSLDGGRTWSANQKLYQSPEGPICPCCSPSVAIEGSRVYITFRNALAGSRDIHLLTSSDGGQHFGQPQKLGTGTWKLEGCPMDGGGVAIAKPGQVVTAWRRENRIYVAEPGKPEQEVAQGGKNVALASNALGNYIIWQADGKVWAITPRHNTPVSLGMGAFPRVAALPQSAVCVWETENGLLATTL
ncbi:hypothetical protein GCM10023189_23550 [Nibrella saemangeumensis]|uniref:BNR repeat-like domain-containing protein n=1 Tax=Nibrella saemangeumensis TaxID=1084526 RepID=A0ABP8MVD4_9BACT